jgi:hypothetical protein
MKMHTLLRLQTAQAVPEIGTFKDAAHTSRAMASQLRRVCHQEAYHAWSIIPIQVHPSKSSRAASLELEDFSRTSLRSIHLSCARSQAAISQSCSIGTII